MFGKSLFLQRNVKNGCGVMAIVIFFLLNDSSCKLKRGSRVKESYNCIFWQQTHANLPSPPCSTLLNPQPSLVAYDCNLSLWIVEALSA